MPGVMARKGPGTRRHPRRAASFPAQTIRIARPVLPDGARPRLTPTISREVPPFRRPRRRFVFPSERPGGSVTGPGSRVLASAAAVMAVMRHRAVLIENEEHSLARLRRLLADFPQEIEVVGEAMDGPSAVEVIRTQTPDLVFLDIDL